MRKILLLLMLTVTAISAEAQTHLHTDPAKDTAYHGLDTTVSGTYVNVIYTDSLNGEYTRHLKMVVTSTDYHNRTLGVAASTTMYLPNGRLWTGFQTTGTQWRAGDYDYWYNSNDPGIDWQMVIKDYAARNPNPGYITVLP